RIEKAPLGVSQGSVGAERHGGDLHAIFLLNELEGAEGVALVGPLDRKFGAGDQVIDVTQHTVKTVIDRIHIDRHRHAGLVRYAGGVLDRGGVVTVNVQQPGAGDLFRGDLRRVDSQGFVAPPENGSFPGALVNDDISRLVGAPLADLHVVDVDVFLEQTLHLDSASLVIADRANVF